jgi:hypothetical protein
VKPDSSETLEQIPSHPNTMHPHTLTREQFFALVLISHRIERNALLLTDAGQSSVTVAEVRANLSGLAADIRQHCGLEAITQANVDELKAKASS